MLPYLAERLAKVVGQKGVEYGIDARVRIGQHMGYYLYDDS